MADATNTRGPLSGLLIKTESGEFTVLDGGPPTPVRPSVSPFPVPSAPAFAPTVVPQKPIAAKSTAAYFLYPEDEEEIRQHAERIEALEAQPAVDLDAVIRKLTTQFNLSFGDPQLQARFRKTVEARLRDIRDDLETMDVLTRSTKVGGLALDPAVAERIMETIGPEAERIHGLKRPEPPRPAAQRVGPPIPKPQPLRPAAPIAAGPLPVPPAPAKPTWAVPPAPRPVPPPPPPAPKPMTPKIERPAVAPDRRVVEDIRRPVRLVGPVDELKQMTLEEFRRLGPPSTATKKVKEKIAALAEESFGKAVEGIKGWRESGVYREYLAIGRESLETAKPIAEVVVAKQARGEQMLSKEEFLAVLQLNKELRF